MERRRGKCDTSRTAPHPRLAGRSGLAAALLSAFFAKSLVPLPLAGARVEPRPVPVIDLHVDLPYQVNYKGARFAEGSGQYDSARLPGSGVAGVVLPLYIPRGVSPDGPRQEDLESSYQNVVRLLPKTPPYSPPGCRGEKGSVRTWLAFEGAAPLAREPSTVDEWIRRGVVSFGLVHTYDNALATSSGAPASKRGLSSKGHEVVRRVFAGKALVDVSHASDAAVADIVALARETKGVVIASHSNARAIAAHPRNLTDEQMRAIASTGGVVGINFHARFLTGGTKARLGDVVRHIQHAVKVAGVEHVAIGSDFEGGIRPPPELSDVRGFLRLSEALGAAGLSSEAVEKIFSKNALRVLCGPEVPSVSLRGDDFTVPPATHE